MDSPSVSFCADPANRHARRPTPERMRAQASGPWKAPAPQTSGAATQVDAWRPRTDRLGIAEWISSRYEKYFFTSFGWAARTARAQFWIRPLDFLRGSFPDEGAKCIASRLPACALGPPRRPDIEWDFDYDPCGFGQRGSFMPNICERTFHPSSVFVEAV